MRALSRGFVLLTLVLGALTGVGIWFTIALVQPQATSALVTTFVWAWAIEWTFFATEIAAAMVYYYGWDRLHPRTHLAVGWIYFGSAWASLAVIAGILAFMLTSGDWARTRGFADGFFNPTYLPMVALRTAVAVGLAGLYVLFAASFLKDAELKARVARWSATRWIAPAALAVPLALLWYLSAAAGAGVAVAETLGARSASPGGGPGRPSSPPSHGRAAHRARGGAGGASWGRRSSSSPRWLSPCSGPAATAGSRPGSSWRSASPRWAAASGSARGCASRG